MYYYMYYLQHIIDGVKIIHIILPIIISSLWFIAHYNIIDLTLFHHISTFICIINDNTFSNPAIFVVFICNIFCNTVDVL